MAENVSTTHSPGSESALQTAIRETSAIIDPSISTLEVTLERAQQVAPRDREDASIISRIVLGNTARPREAPEVAVRRALREQGSMMVINPNLEQYSNHDWGPFGNPFPTHSASIPLQEEMDMEEAHVDDADMEDVAPLTAPASIAGSEAPRIQAFAKLEFENSDYYMNTYSVIIGRDKKAKRIVLARDTEENMAPEMAESRRKRSKTSKSTKSSSSRKSSTIPKDYTDYETLAKASRDPDAGNPFDSCPPPEVCPLVAINDHVGEGAPIRFTAISREHALVAFNFNKNIFEVTILGGNGLFIDDAWYPKDDVQPLKNGSLLQLGGARIRFSLPDVGKGETGAETIASSSSNTADHASTESGERNENGAMTNDSEDESDEESESDDEEDVSDVEDQSQVQEARSEEEGEEEEEEEIASEEEHRANGGRARSKAKMKAKVKPKAEPKAKAKVKPKPKLNIKIKPPASPGPDPDPTLPVPKRRGPGRPPKNGIISKREQALQARQAREAAKAAALKEAEQNGTSANGQNQNGIKSEDGPLQPITAKRKYTKRKSKEFPAGEQNGDAASTEHTESNPPDALGLAPKPQKEKKPPKPPRSPSPVYDESTMTEEQLTKPSASYVILIHEALTNSPTGAMSLPQIYRAIERRYPYYKLRVTTTGWQSSVRHNLSQHAAFRKIEREGKGWMWGLVPEVSIEKEKKRRASPPAVSQQQSYQGHMIQNPYGYQGMPHINGHIPHVPYPQYGMPPGYLPHHLSGHIPPNGLPLPLANAHVNSSSIYQSPYQSAPPFQHPQQSLAPQDQNLQQPQLQSFQQSSQQTFIPQQNLQEAHQQLPPRSFQPPPPLYSDIKIEGNINPPSEAVQPDQNGHLPGSNTTIASNYQNAQSSSSSYSQQPSNNTISFPNQTSQDVRDAVSRFKDGFVSQMEDKTRGELLVDSAIKRVLGMQTTSSVSEDEEDPQELVIMRHLVRVLDDVNRKTAEAQRQASQSSATQISPTINRSHLPPMHGSQENLLNPTATHQPSDQQSTPQQNSHNTLSLAAPPNDISHQETATDPLTSNHTIENTTKSSPDVGANPPGPNPSDEANENINPSQPRGTKRPLDEDPETTSDVGQPEAKRVALG